MRTFLTARNRTRFRAKWAGILERHAEPGDLPRALAPRRGGGGGASARRARPPPGATPLRPPADDRLFLRLDREVKDGLIAQLTDEVEALHATIGRKDSELVAQEAALHELHAELSRRAASSRTG